MTSLARRLLDEALTLPAEDRAALAADLLASLEDPPDIAADTDADAAWRAELERRARDAVANPDDDLAWESVRAELHADRSPA